MSDTLRPVRVGADYDGDGHFDEFDAYCKPDHPDAKFYYRDDVDALVATLRARLAEAERDAARYRWLRDNGGAAEATYVLRYDGEQFDALIDAAMVEANTRSEGL